MIFRLVSLLFVTFFLSSCASESIMDRRHGQQLVCHDGKKTLTVSNADNLAHLNHGDTAGPCPGNNS